MRKWISGAVSSYFSSTDQLHFSQDSPQSNSIHIGHNNPVGSDIKIKQTNPFNTSIHISLNVGSDSKVHN